MRTTSDRDTPFCNRLFGRLMSFRARGSCGADVAVCHVSGALTLKQL